MHLPSIARSVLRLAAVWLGLLAVSPAALQAEDLPADDADSKISAAFNRKARAARRAVGELGLTRRQARRMLPIVEQAAALYIEGYQREAELFDEMIEVFGDFAREDRLGQGFSPHVERRAAGVNRRGKEDRQRITDQLIALEQQAGTVLTRSQRELAGLNETKRKRVSGRRRHGQSNSLAAARQELDALRRQIHPRLGKLGQHLLHPAAAEALCKTAGTRPSDIMRQAAEVLQRGTDEYPMPQFEAQRAEVKRLRDEINNWNLINGLHLDSRQIEQILAVADDPGAGGRAFPNKGGAAGGKRQAALVARERGVEAILNPGQREVLAEYKPCLIPPKNLKDPVRIGQANDRSHVERWLTRARKVSGDRLHGLVDRALEKEAERFGELPPDQLRERRALLLKTAREVAAMSDVDFEINKAELAERVAPRDRVQELRTKVASMSRARGLPGVVARFMLNPLFLEQLAGRGRQLAEQVEFKQTGLAKGPQAENCDKGCALKKSSK